MKSETVKVSAMRALGHAEAMRLARTEYERFSELLGSLSEADMSKATDCGRWNVQAIVSHLIGMSEAFGSFKEMQRQQRIGKALGKELGLTKFDGWTEFQSRRYGEASVDDITRLFDERWPVALRRRERIRAPIRWMRIPSPPYGWFSLAYLLDDILTRDVWMHRVDISRATGHDLELTAKHDGPFVGNIVRDLAARWKRPFSLTLEGPAGGTFTNGAGGNEIRVDPVEFCRILSGRDQGHGLPTDVVPF